MSTIETEMDRPDVTRHQACRNGFLGGLAMAGLIALVGVLGAHEAGFRKTEQRLSQQVTSALRPVPVANLTVTMDGQVARLSGTVPSEQDITNAQALALRAAGRGGPWAGGVVKVDTTGLVLARTIDPFTWKAERRGPDAVVLTGYVPDATAKATLLTKARSLFAQVTDETQIAQGAPDRAWADNADLGLEQLAKLTRGEARMTGTRLVLIGEASATNLAQIRAVLDPGLVAPYQARVDVTETGRGLNVPELAGLDLGNAEAATCQEGFRRIMARNVINFESGSAQVSRGSLALISNLASVAFRCDDFTIQVSGHTDNVGDPALNQQLSEARANQVVQLLRAEGVAADRLGARGFGASQPVADNTTERGRAQNRRIEFAVTQ